MAGKQAASDFDQTYFEDRSIYSKYVGSAAVLEDWYAVLLKGVERTLGHKVVQPGAQVLDAGCGYGTTASLFTQRQCRVVASDISSFVLQRVVESVSFPLVNADVSNLPFRSECFDAALAFEILEHVPDPAPAVAELVRVVRQGGMVLFTTPNPLSAVIPFIDPWSDETHVSVLPTRRWLTIAREAGLEDVRAFTMLNPPVLWRRFPTRIRSIRMPLVGPIIVLIGYRS